MGVLYSEKQVIRDKTAKDSLTKYGLIVLTALAAFAGLFINPIILIVAIALICMVGSIWFVGIPAAYCISSVITMAIVGNLVLYLLMRFVGLPNQIKGE